jgi:hypothetical protein
MHLMWLIKDGGRGRNDFWHDFLDTWRLVNNNRQDWPKIYCLGTKLDVLKVEGPIWAFSDSLRTKMAISPKIFIKKRYRYIFMKLFFKTNLFIWFLYFQTQQLKSYSWFIFPMFDPNLVQNDFLYGYGGSISQPRWSLQLYQGYRGD